jgi:hypothetical protein
MDPSGLLLQSFNEAVVKQAKEKLLSFGEAKKLFDDVNMKLGGKLTVVPKEGLEYPAQWDPNTKQIQIDVKKFQEMMKMKNINLDLLLYYIMIELTNAENDAKYKDWDDRARKGELSKKQFAEGKERLEYEAFKKAQKLLEAGVKAKKYNPEAFKGGIPEWPEYLKKQREGGHTKVYEKQWEKNFKEAWEKKHPGEDPCK